MAPNFRLVAIDHEPFEPLFDLSDEALKARGAQRCIATESPGFPCRVSLEDAQVGEALLLLPYLHQAAPSPYRASGPIFVRRGMKRRDLAAGEVPNYVTRRLISLRAYDAAHMMVAAGVIEGSQVAREIDDVFANGQVAYIHLHNAKRGCFSCRVDRA